MIALVSGLCCAAPARAIDSSAGTGAGAFMKIGLGSARAMGMGGAYTALASGADGLSWNPAAIAVSQQREVSFSHLAWLQDYGGNYAAYVHPLGQNVLGVNLGWLGADNFDARDAAGRPTPSQNVTVNDTFLTVALARTFFAERLSVGGALKRVYESNDGDNYSSIVADAGAQLRLFNNSLALGFVVQNSGGSSDVVRTTRYGAAYTFSQYLTMAAEIESPSDNRSRSRLGLELTLPEEVLQVGRFALRAGYYDADDHGTNYDDGLLKDLKLDKTSSLTFGAGIYSGEVFGYAAGLDIAIAPYGELGRATQLSLKVAF